MSQQLETFRAMFDCDTARIYQGFHKMFLIIGWNRNTKKQRESGVDRSQWYRNGIPYDFDFVEEKVIASGETDDELMASAKEYKRLSNLTMEEYLRELLDRPAQSGSEK